MTMVRCSNLCKRFGAVTALDQVDLEVPSGEFFFVLGPSGCGKTSLLRVIAGLEEPDAGLVLFNGRPMAAVPPQQRNVGLVFQNYALWPHMTVSQNTSFGLEARGWPAARREVRVREVLSLVRCTALAERYPHQLSGGEQQRVALARALAPEPDVILLDEPLSNLDAQLRMIMRAELQELQAQLKVTMLYVTHDQGEALALADRIAILEHGKVRAVGRPEQLYEDPQDVFVASFLGETNIISAQVLKCSELQVQIQCGLGSLECDPSLSWPRQGQPVLVSIRPERICLSAAATPGALLPKNAFRAEVLKRSYQGERSMLQVVCGKQELRILESPASTRHLPGVQVDVSVPASCIKIVQP